MEEFLTTLSATLLVVWTIIKTWWWVLLPIFAWKRFIFMWRRWREEAYSKTVGYAMFEIKMPREVDRPFKAMEQVFAGWWMLFDPADWWEYWWEGKYQVKISIEIVSDGGEIHFYLRFPKALRNLIEASIYSQYPEVELIDAEDYTKKIPQDIPNESWDLWGCDYELMKPDIYPIKTYERFFEETNISKEYQRIDPMGALLEGLSQTKPGEQIWVQFILKPVTNVENNYKDRAKAEVAKLAFRGDPRGNMKDSTLIKKAIDVVAFGKMPDGPVVDKPESILPPEMKLTPGEREIVAQIEHKISKTMFETVSRFIILGEKDKWNKANLKNILGYYANFNTENTNNLKPWSPSITKIHKHESFFTNLFLHDRKLYLKKRKLISQYSSRFNYNFPKDNKENFVLNLEELASMFHFVGRSAIPSPNVQRIESKKAEPPTNLPS